MDLVDVVTCVTTHTAEIKFNLAGIWTDQDDSSVFLRKVVQHIQNQIFEKKPAEEIDAKTIASELRIGLNFTVAAFKCLVEKRENIVSCRSGTVRYFLNADQYRVHQAIYEARDVSEGACVSTIAENLSLDAEYLGIIITAMIDRMEIFYVDDMNHVKFWRPSMDNIC